jgi:hypothetical protein
MQAFRFLTKSILGVGQNVFYKKYELGIKIKNMFLGILIWIGRLDGWRMMASDDIGGGV